MGYDPVMRSILGAHQVCRKTGVCVTDLWGEPARHRGLSACLGLEALQPRGPFDGFIQYAREYDARLAYLRRLRIEPDRHENRDWARVQTEMKELKARVVMSTDESVRLQQPLSIKV